MSRFKFTNGNRFWSVLSQKPMRTAEEMAARKRNATLRADITRKLKKNERLTGDVLEYALRACDETTADKLKNGEPLSGYEKRFIIDVVLSGTRLAP